MNTQVKECCEYCVLPGCDDMFLGSHASKLRRDPESLSSEWMRWCEMLFNTRKRTGRPKSGKVGTEIPSFTVYAFVTWGDAVQQILFNTGVGWQRSKSDTQASRLSNGNRNRRFLSGEQNMSGQNAPQSTLRHVKSVALNIKTPFTLILLTWRIWWAPINASKWQMGYNLVFKGTNDFPLNRLRLVWKR